MPDRPTAHDLAARFIERLEARDWAAWTALMEPNVVYEVPQTRERIRGRDAYLTFNREFPGDWHLTAQVVIGEGAHASVLFSWEMRDTDPVESALAIVFFEIGATGLITKVSDFWPDPYEPLPGREHLVERY